MSSSTETNTPEPGKTLEYVSLQAELPKRIGLRQQLMSITLTLVGAFFGVGLSNCNTTQCGNGTCDTGETAQSYSRDGGGVVVSGEPWAGFNCVHGARLKDETILDLCVSALNELNINMVRAGVNHPLDVQRHIYQTFIDHGIAVHSNMMYGDPAQYVPAMQRFKGVVKYYIIGNEPDGTSHYSPEQILQNVKAAYDASRQVAPDGSIKVESSPLQSPVGTGDYMRLLLNAGITRYADVFGFHAYSTEIDENNPNNMGATWELMRAAHNAYGYPMIPIACSEDGTRSTWAPAGMEGRAYMARWFRQNYVQQKRYGVSNVILFSINPAGNIPNDPTGTAMGIGKIDGTAWTKFQPVWDSMRSAYTDRAFANGGFEQSNDRELDWVITIANNQVNPVEWTRVSFVQNDAANAHSGGGYVRTAAPVKVRRVANGLTPGKQITLSGWVNVGSGATAKLKAQGYNRLGGDEEVVASSSDTGGRWRQLTLNVTPTNPWVVVSLETEGSGSVKWDDITIDGKMQM